MRRPTLRDVAARAGVSHQTVSRVINADDRVLGETRERVLVAIRELDYVPNGIAQSLAARRTRTLGVSVADISAYSVGQMIAGAEETARRAGFFLIVGSTEESPAPAMGDAWREHTGRMLHRGIDGLILAWPSLPAEVRPVLARIASRVPLVTLSSQPNLPGAGTVSIDNQRGAFDATTFLISQGHRGIATIAGPAHWRASVTRLEGYERALRQAGIAPRASLTVRCDDWDPLAGRQSAATLLDAGEPFTAIFAQNDLLALGAISAIRDRGLCVPED
ncbi:MAG TPA: LacI family DNA-binding transcriptional regulator, partial [Thermomicrobiales bacterium]|nr:LacI family DNA-binding transcriptional regulator [Thermomicrobiales bacterium]